MVPITSPSSYEPITARHTILMIPINRPAIPVPIRKYETYGSLGKIAAKAIPLA